jgi:DNA-binding NtrC family response regulator
VRGGRLVHRQAEFITLLSPDTRDLEGCGILVLLGDRDLTPQDLAAEVAADPTADELHRTIRRFRRAQAGTYAIECLLGESTVMQKVRAQVAAAAASGAKTIIYGKPGTGRGHVARAIHYRAAVEAAVRLVPVDCEHAKDDALRRALDALRSPSDDPRHRPTLLLENLDRLDLAQQSQLLTAVQQTSFRARLVATCSRHDPLAAVDAVAGNLSQQSANQSPADGSQSESSNFDPALLDLVSTMVIDVPRLAERPADLPILAQSFLEACNRGSAKQVGSLRADALDQLALYAWPGELDEMREAIAAAHAACESHEITPADLPAVIHHAAQAASRIRKRPERIVLDELLAQIEREAIVRALAQADGNKTEAAEWLGMTRPRLYRRLVQLGLVTETKGTQPELPEFVERPASDETP